MPLYHGTSTLFVESILEHGLGGVNVVAEWGLLDLAREVRKLSEEYLPDWEDFQKRRDSFGRMTSQEVGYHNWQHGDTYLSLLRRQAESYAISKRYGSELLTYTLDCLEELVRRDVSGVKDELYQRFPRLFNILSISPAPIVVEVRGVPIESLCTEHGHDISEIPHSVPDDILEIVDKRQPAERQDALSQLLSVKIGNFRLFQPIPFENLKFSMINVTQWGKWNSEYKLYELNLLPRTVG